MECLHDYQYFIFHLKYDTYLLEKKKNQYKKVQVWDLLDPRPLRNVISRIYHGFIDAIHNTLLTYFPNLFYFVRRAKPYLDFSLE